MTQRKSFLIKVCAVVSSVAFFVLLLEAILALAQINTKSNVRFVPGRGSTYLPHSYYRHTKEGFSEGYFNSHGFRDHERSYTKPKDTFRIIILGDSYVEGLQVALEDAFPALLEKKLNENSGSLKFEVLNLGQAGFGTADEYMRYLNFGIKYQPDLVILAFLTGNDIRNNSKVLNNEGFAFYFRFDESGHLALDRSVMNDYQSSLTPLSKIFKFIKRNSYLASLISERLYLLNWQLRKDRIRKMLEQTDNQNKPATAERRVQKHLDVLSDLNIYLPKMTNRWKEAFAITKAALLKFRKSVEENGNRFVLVTLSNAEQVHPSVQKRLVREYGSLFDFEQPDRIIENFAKRENIAYLKLMPAFREYHLRTGKYLHGFRGDDAGHWNENGHKLAAEQIFAFLKENHLVAAGEPGATERELTL